MKSSFRIVIDASVARSAGETDAVDSVNARRVLEEIRKICHRMVLTPYLEKEWETHRSRFAKAWQASMVSKRKVEVVPDPSDDDPLQQIPRLPVFSPKKAKAVRKDLHLLSAAFQTDRLILSQDESLKNDLRLAETASPQLKKLRWLNPREQDCVQRLRTSRRR